MRFAFRQQENLMFGSGPSKKLILLSRLYIEAATALTVAVGIPGAETEKLFHKTIDAVVRKWGRHRMECGNPDLESILFLLKRFLDLDVAMRKEVKDLGGIPDVMSGASFVESWFGPDSKSGSNGDARSH